MRRTLISILVIFLMLVFTINITNSMTSNININNVGEVLNGGNISFQASRGNNRALESNMRALRMFLNDIRNNDNSIEVDFDFNDIAVFIITNQTLVMSILTIILLLALIFLPRLVS